MLIKGRRKSSGSQSALAIADSLTRETINERFAAIISNTRQMRVVRDDILGEGKGAWDPDPRYPTDTVNCIIWLQLVICEIYGWGHDLGTKIRIMDRIRYYGGHVAYGLRKTHYVDHWLQLEPEPLIRVSLNSFPGYQRGFIKVNKERFKTFHQYSCRLYREELDFFNIDSITGDGLLQCIRELTPGYYIAFGVAGSPYLDLYGRNTGPMGLVHSLIIRVSNDAHLPGDETLVYHASIISGTVDEAPLTEYVGRMTSLFQGYALFELDPNWDFLATPAEDEEVKRILRCEAALPRHDHHRRL